MNHTEQQAQFAWSVEDEFLPKVIKPGRYASVEWICPPPDDSCGKSYSASNIPNADTEFPLAVVLSLKSYERSANAPQIVAARLALLDSRCFRVGITYPFGDESIEVLQNLELAPFSGPEFCPLTKANILVVSLNDWADLMRLPQVLQNAGIPLSQAQRHLTTDKDNFPQLVALLDDTLGDCDTAVPSLITEIFDSVVILSEFLAAPTKSLGLHVTSDKASPLSPLIPSRPIVPLVEVSQHKARFRLNSGLKRGAARFSEAVISAELVTSTKLSGLNEIELEGCVNALGSIDLATVIDTLAHRIDARRYALSLRDLHPEQVTPLLAGALGRFRRVRVELSLASLSSTACAECGQSFNRENFVACLQRLQIESVQTLHLRLELGFDSDTDVEAQETCETLLECANALDIRRGLRVKFERHISQFAPIPSEERIQNLFAAIKRRCRIKGVTFVLEDSLPKLFGALVERNAFSTVEEFVSFVDTSGADTDVFAVYSEILSKRYENQISATTASTGIETEARNERSEVAFVAEKQEPTELANSSPVNQSASFGRRKKRSVITTVSAPTKTRLRFTWSVTGPARFLSHLDNIRAIESALLRSGMALSYTQGQRPRPKISFGAPKPVGFTSECELFDVYFETTPTANDIVKLDPLLPPGYRIVSASQSLTKELSILESIKCATYLIGIADHKLGETQSETLADILPRALAQSRLVYTRRSKKRERQVDLRPGVFEAKILEESDSDYASFFNFATFGPGKSGSGRILKLTLALTDSFHVRPEEFLDAAGILTRSQSTVARIHRLRYGFETLPPLQVGDAQLAKVSN